MLLAVVPSTEGNGVIGFGPHACYGLIVICISVANVGSFSRSIVATKNAGQRANKIQVGLFQLGQDGFIFLKYQLALCGRVDWPTLLRSQFALAAARSRRTVGPISR